MKYVYSQVLATYCYYNLTADRIAEFKDEFQCYISTSTIIMQHFQITVFQIKYLAHEQSADSDPVIIPYKIINRIFTIYDVIQGEPKKCTKGKCYNFSCYWIILLRFGYVHISHNLWLKQFQFRISKIFELSSIMSFCTFYQLCTLITSLLGVKNVPKFGITILIFNIRC